MNELQNIWNDIKNRNFLEAYIVLFLGLLILIASIFGVKNESVMSQLILAILSTLVYLNIKERREYLRLSKEKDIEGISAFHSSRASMPKLDHLIKGARREIILYATKHGTLVHQYLGVLKEKVDMGCKVKILVLASKDKDGNLNPNVLDIEKQRFATELLPTLEANTKALLNWRDSLALQSRNRVEIRKYWENPTVFYTVVDKDENDGFFMTEVLIPNVPLFDVPHYIISKRENELFFATHVQSASNIWNNAEPLINFNNT